MKNLVGKWTLVASGFVILSNYACSTTREGASGNVSAAVSPNTSDNPPTTVTSATSIHPSDGIAPDNTTEATTMTTEPRTKASTDSVDSASMPSGTAASNGIDSTASPSSHGGSRENTEVDAETEDIAVEPSGTCSASTIVDANARGSGAHGVVVETNSGSGIKEGTIFRPEDLGGAEKYPIFVWGQGACSKNGLANAAAMTEIASHGYFVVADGTPNGSGNRTMDRADLVGMGAPLMAYVDWAVAENAKPCSAYYQRLETAKIASNGFSCGGLMSQGTVLDPRVVTWGVTSSGMAGATDDFYEAIHTPVLFVEGGTGDVAYEGALQGYNRVSQLGVAVMWFDKALGHGGDLFQANGGDFTKINLAWLNWWLKGDEGITGKGLLVGPDCSYCSDSQWDVRSNNVP